MAKPVIEPETDAALVPLADRLSALPGVKVFDGARDDEGWWQLLFRIDVGCDNAWRTVRILSSLFNTIIPTDENDGMPIFFPFAHTVPDFDPDKGPYWSLSRESGEYTPDDATTVLSEYLVWENLAQATAGDFDARKSAVKIDRGLASLSKQISAISGVKTRRGYVSEENWWLLFDIDIDRDDAWRTVRIFASLFNVMTPSDGFDGSAIFKPAARPTPDFDPDEGPYWSLSHLWGEYTPDDAAATLSAYVAAEQDVQSKNGD